jgi:hypothetical protein
MSTWLTPEISVPAQSCVPMPSTIVVIQLDPVATLNDFQDEAIRQAAAALQTKKYVVYTQDVRQYPLGTLSRDIYDSSYRSF